MRPSTTTFRTWPIRNAIRAAPLPFDARKAAREEVMDRHPWTYQVMADEMIREEDHRRAKARTGDQRPAQLRLFRHPFESNRRGAKRRRQAQRRSGLASVRLGIANYRIDRSGNFRTTALLPKRARLEEIERVVARCDVKGDPRTQPELSQVPSASRDLRSINKIFVLDDDYMPGEPLKLSFRGR